MPVKLRNGHLKLSGFLKEGGRFLLIFFIVFIVVFAIFNSRAFYEQLKYMFKVDVEKNEEFLKQLLANQNQWRDIPDSIIIPKINVNAPIIFPRTSDEKTLYNQLSEGVVHYPNSALPGKIGNMIILGHSSAYPWYKGKYGSIFSLLNQLKSNDEIIIIYKEHKYTYRVVSKEFIKKDTVIPEQNEKSRLVLISCWPIGTTWKRILINAELFSKEP